MNQDLKRTIPPGSPLLPLVSIIIPIPPGLKNPTVLSSLRNLNYPKDRLEVLVVEGRWPPRQRNLAARQARGEYLLFLDDDVRVPPDYLREMLEWYERWKSDGLGGPCLPLTNGSSQGKAIAYSLQSGWALGPLRDRYSAGKPSQDASDRQIILCNFSIRQKSFLSTGGFSERLFPNEENELMDRLRAMGMRLGYAPSLTVTRPVEPTIASHWRKLFCYGQGRARQLKVNTSLQSLEHLLLACLGLGLILGLLFRWPWAGWLGLAYMGWTIGATLHAGWRFRALRPTLLAGWTILGMHLAYLIGFWWGFLKRVPQTGGTGSDEIILRREPADQSVPYKVGQGKIAFISMTYSRSPTLTCRILPVARALQAQGTPVTIFALNESSQGQLDRITLEEMPIRLIGQAHFTVGPHGEKIRFGPGRYAAETYRTFHRLLEQLREIRPSLVHIFTTDPGALLIAIGLQACGYRVALDLDDSGYGMALLAKYPKPILWAQWLMENLLPWLIPRLTAATEARAQQYPRALRRQIVLLSIANSISTTEFPRRRNPCSGASVTVIMVGSMAAPHLQMDVIRTIPRIVKENPRIRFCFIGTGERLPVLKEAVHTLGLDPAVELTGYLRREEVLERMREADIGICPLGENPFDRSRLPMKLLEYMAAGLAVVTAPVGQVPAIIRHLENGWLYKAGDMDDFSRGILTLAADPDLAKRLAGQAQEDASAFDANRLAPRWLSFYQEATGCPAA